MSKKAVQIIFGVFALCLAYAILRYHVFGGVGLKDFPLYVLNKTISLTGFILLSITFTLGPAKALGVDVPDPWLKARKEIGIVSFMLILTHVLSAMLLFGSGGYYSKFFMPDEGISAVGGWSMFLGVLAFVWLWLYNISFKSRQEGDEDFIQLITSKGSLILAGFLSAGHLAVMGFAGWLKPEDWAGGMPPITLVGIAVFVVSFVVVLFGKR